MAKLTEIKMLERVLSAYEETFPRRHGFYPSVSCPLCGGTISDHNAGKIWHTHNCLVREAREMIVDSCPNIKTVSEP